VRQRLQWGSGRSSPGKCALNHDRRGRTHGHDDVIEVVVVPEAREPQRVRRVGVGDGQKPEEQAGKEEGDHALRRRRRCAAYMRHHVCRPPFNTLTLPPSHERKMNARYDGEGQQMP